MKTLRPASIHPALDGFFKCSASTPKRRRAERPPIALYIIVICIMLSVFVGNGVSTVQAAEKESAYDRVMRTGVLRCGYGSAPQWIQVNPNTGKPEGFMVDITEELAKRLSLKVQWDGGDVGWDQVITAIESGRVDIACSTLWQSAARGRVLRFTRPLFFNNVRAYARADDPRFTGKIDEINNSDITLPALDGDVSREIADSLFPKAKVLTLPQMTGAGDTMMTVVTKKADVVFVEPGIANQFMATNPGSLKLIPLRDPVKTYPSAYAVGIHEHELASMIDSAVAEMLESGIVEKLIKKHTNGDLTPFMPPAKPYEVKN